MSFEALHRLSTVRCSTARIRQLFNVSSLFSNLHIHFNMIIDLQAGEIKSQLQDNYSRSHASTPFSEWLEQILVRGTPTS